MGRGAGSNLLGQRVAGEEEEESRGGGEEASRRAGRAPGSLHRGANTYSMIINGIISPTWRRTDLMGSSILASKRPITAASAVKEATVRMLEMASVATCAASSYLALAACSARPTAALRRSISSSSSCGTQGEPGEPVEPGDPAKKAQLNTCECMADG